MPLLKPDRPSKPRTTTPKRAAAGEREVASESGTKRTRAVKTTSDSGSAQTDPAVEAFLEQLDHPCKQEIAAVRRILLGASPEIREGIKWSAPSFRTTEYFATFHLRTRSDVRLILHLGAKVRATATTGIEIPDPEGLLNWLARDRCLVTLADAADIAARGPALQAIVRAWIRWV